VLAKISGVFGTHNVSITDVIQKENTDENNNVPIIFMTHKTSVKSMMAAINEIKKLENVVENVDAIIRVEK
jgi:homoserine dehydrogenase